MDHRTLFLSLLALSLLAIPACSSSSSSDEPPIPNDDAGASPPDGSVAHPPPPPLDAGPDAALPPPKLGTCGSLAAPGTWEQITPPTVLSQLPGPSDCTFGVGSFVLDPSSYGTVYLGTCEMGIWKTTDCGSSWMHVNTGKNGAMLDTGRQWTFVVDPVDPRVLYTNSGYNAKGVSGAFKSANGGVDWEQLWPPADGSLANVVQYNFVGQIVLDPTDHTHLLVSFHAACMAPHGAACFAETKDAGKTWSIVDGEASWVGGEGQSVWFLDGPTNWLFGSQSNGLWRTTNGGASWTLIDSNIEGHGGGQLYRASTGAYYLPVSTGILRSSDGVSWTVLAGSGNTMAGLTGDGTTMWASSGFPWNQGQGPAPYLPFFTSQENDGTQWAQMPSPKLSNGGPLAYDKGHHLLYSSNEYAGFWRVVTGP